MESGKNSHDPTSRKLWCLALIAALKQQLLEISLLSSNSYVEINYRVEATEINAG